MADVEHRRRLAGKPPIKYYGKWPFQRVLGMQEVASVLFSLANLGGHVLGLRFLVRKHRLLSNSGSGWAEERTVHKGTGELQTPARAAYPYMWLWLAYAGLHLNAWVWSAVFHVRDTRTTERLDYCSAITVVAAGGEGHESPAGAPALGWCACTCVECVCVRARVCVYTSGQGVPSVCTCECQCVCAKMVCVARS